ncbi:MAG TPA: hypothetical protein VHE30_16670 [Polyangiaceae bacterium]|nr:hypothetical protein [Polyangiaceae bacterium]
MKAVAFCLLLGASLLGVACSDDANDAIGGACDTIVAQCHVGRSQSECIDLVGTLSAECIDCIGTSGCDYPSCQVTVPGCRVPVSLLK